MAYKSSKLIWINFSIVKKLFLFCFLIFVSCKKEREQFRLSGAIFGTTYTILYDGEENFQSDFDQLFQDINNALSTYVPSSMVSKINKNNSIEVDEHFEKVFRVSKEIYKATDGRFDPTIGAVVNAWDFGPTGVVENLDSLKIKKLMQSVGFDKVKLEDSKILKPIETALDFNAIAKGYAVDVIAEFLASKNSSDFLIEIGGEIRCSGLNAAKQKLWVVGLQNPDLNSELPYVDKVTLNNASMATSGTYRKFKIDENGLRYTHIMDTKTGYPSPTNILSVSVIADDCMTADAYATALQTMPVGDMSIFLESHPELKVFIVFESEDKALEFRSFNGFQFYKGL